MKLILFIFTVLLFSAAVGNVTLPVGLETAVSTWETTNNETAQILWCGNTTDTICEANQRVIGGDVTGVVEWDNYAQAIAAFPVKQYQIMTCYDIGALDSCVINPTTFGAYNQFTEYLIVTQTDTASLSLANYLVSLGLIKL